MRRILDPIIRKLNDSLCDNLNINQATFCFLFDTSQSRVYCALC